MRFSMKTLLASALVASSVYSQSTLTNFTDVRTDLKALYTNSQAFWPADFGNYAPFFVRLAWHCAGSYRVSDGRGGCDGARQRFDPERSWDDNTNLDKARKLLQPIKLKYGDALSWGDLIILAGTTAIESMGGPVLGFCGGRIDDMDGTASLKLGPTAEQVAYAPCPVNGNCTAPLGTTTVGLIYVNPEGPMGNPDPAGSAPQIRDTFGRMAMNDSETVALIGGGHAFGKTHGACPLGAGPAPNVQPSNPWPGNCGNGKGANTFTSGFEGPWTTTPTVWGNEYFQNLINNNWSVTIGPGGHHQWNTSALPTMMLTTDISLTNDTSYLALVQQYASDKAALENAFKHAWYKLVSRDMGPVSRCTGENIPPAQPFQYPLPSTPSQLANFTVVRQLISSGLATTPSMTSKLIHLTYQCAGTFRQTDYLGGCNGARIRFSPQATWKENIGTGEILDWLNTTVMSQYTGSGALSWADLIVLAGQVAVEQASGASLNFCPGRTDATDGTGSEFLSAADYNMNNDTQLLILVRDRQEISGLTAKQWVVLQGRPRPADTQLAIGYTGTWSSSTSLSNAYFTTLLNNVWSLQVTSSNLYEYTNNNSVYMTPKDLALTWDAEYLAYVQEYAANNTLFLQDFASAWTTLVNIDRFSGPTGNVCYNTTTAAANVPTVPAATTSAPAATTSAPAALVYKTQKVAQDPGIWIFLAVGLVIFGGFFYSKITEGRFPGCADRD